LMRLVRRAKGAAAARQVFARARRAEWCTWQVYAAAADLEHQMGADADAADATGSGGVVAARVLALALERYEGDAALTLHCVDFLTARRDVTNARAVLERSLASPTCQQCKELWARYLDLELRFGTPASLRAVEMRRAAAHPELRVDSLYQLAALHAYHGLWPAQGRALVALAETSPTTATDQLPAGGSTSGGGGGGVPPVPPLTVPNLSGCVEYTGEALPIDSPGGAAASGGGSDSELLVPSQLDAVMNALPPRLLGAATGAPSAPDVERLCSRLGELPDSLGELPLAAAALPGPSGAW